MATVTLTIDAELLEAAKIEAERRNTSLDEMISEYFASIAHQPKTLRNADNLIRLMNEGGLLGNIDKPLTREEIYAERTRPRS